MMNMPQPAPEATFELSFFENDQDNDPAKGTTTWSKFVDNLREPLSRPVPAPTTPEEWKASKGTLPMWSPATFRGTRLRANVVSVCMLTYDVDQTPVPSLELLRATALAGNMRSVVHTSSKSLAASPVWRLAILTSRPMTKEEHPRVWRAVERVLPFKVGQEAKDPGRCWYDAREGADGSYTCEAFDGEPLDVDAYLALEPADAPSAPVSLVSVDERAAAATSSIEDDRAAAATMFSKRWPPNGRHKLQNDLAGALVRGGLSDGEATAFLCHVCRLAGDEDPVKRAQSVATARAKKNADLPYTGFPDLADALGAKFVEAARLLMALPTDTRATAGMEGLFLPKAPTPSATVANDTRKWPTAAERASRLGGKCTRLATGFSTLDGCVRGGLPLGKVIGLGGAPGASKTTTCISLGHRWMRAGVYVGILAADEDASGLLVRIGQLEGFERPKLEDGDPVTRAAFAKRLEALPLLLADADEEYVAVEDISAELRRLASGAPSVLIVDSIQTVRAKGTQESGNPRERVNCVMAALKKAAKVDGHLVIATCELARGAYRSRDAAEHIDDLAAFKESGDVEYGAGLLLVMRSRPGMSDVFDVTMPKNRLGHKAPFALKLDFARASLVEVAAEMTGDPMVPIKSRILALYAAAEFSPLTRTFITQQVGGRKSVVVKAINELVDALELVESPNGLMRPALKQFS